MVYVCTLVKYYNSSTCLHPGHCTCNSGAAIRVGNPGEQSCKIFVFGCNPGGT